MNDTQKVARLFPLGLSCEERDLLHEMMGALCLALRDVPWILYAGSLIGAELIGDILPWDDDIDVLAETLPARLEIGRFAEYRLTYCDGQQLVKIFDPCRMLIPGFPYSFPFIDLATMEVSADEVRHPRTQGGFDVFPAADVLPVRRARLGPNMVNVPASPAAVISSKYGKDWRLSSPPQSWSHRREWHTFLPPERVPVADLLAYHRAQGWEPSTR